MKKLKVNLIGSTFKHNIVDNVISSTFNKIPQYIEFVNDFSGEISLFIDQAILDVKNYKLNTESYAWILESKSIHPNLIEFFKSNTEEKVADFKYIFTHNRELLRLHDKFKFLHPIGYWVDDKQNILKTKLISMVTSNKSHTNNAKIRYKFAKKNIKKIDIFGKGFHPIANKEIALFPYCFSIVIENDSTPDYFSEKLLDCFASKTIPIYLGTKTIGNFFDIKGIIDFENFNFKNITYEHYLSLEKYVKNNFNEVKKFKLPEDNLFENYLKTFK